MATCVAKDASLRSREDNGVICDKGGGEIRRHIHILRLKKDKNYGIIIKTKRKIKCN